MSAVPSVVTQALSKVYPDGTRALDGLDVSIAGGEFVGLLGPNGAGKSTTLRLLAGLALPTSGTAQVLGADPVRDPLTVKSLVGYLPEEGETYEYLTGEELLVMTARVHGFDRATAAARAADLLALLDLGVADRARQVAAYSAGMRRKVLFGCALIHRPRVLLLDEPFANIDVVTAETLRAVLLALANRGTAVLFSSHVLESVERICTRMLVLHDGTLRADGDLPALREQARADDGAGLADVFLSLVGQPRVPDIPEWLA